MHRVLKGVMYGAGALGLVVIVASAGAFTVSNRKLAEKHEVRLTTVAVPDDPESVAWGGHLVNNVTNCRECHGMNLEGMVMGDDPVARMVAPNLTRGRGGIGATFTDADWVRAIRHGVRQDGRSLIVMPSYAYAYLSDRDLGAVIAYVKQVEPVDNELPQFRLRPLGRALVAAGAFDEDIVARKVPQRERYDSVEPGLTLEYGQYLATVSGCTSCHKANLKGGPAGPPDAPPAADISPAALRDWTRDDFFRALREGRRPDGTEISDWMPWRFMQGMTDEELDAIWLYIRSVEA